MFLKTGWTRKTGREGACWSSWFEGKYINLSSILNLHQLSNMSYFFWDHLSNFSHLFWTGSAWKRWRDWLCRTSRPCCEYFSAPTCCELTFCASDPSCLDLLTLGTSWRKRRARTAWTFWLPSELLFWSNLWEYMKRDWKDTYVHCIQHQLAAETQHKESQVMKFIILLTYFLLWDRVYLDQLDLQERLESLETRWVCPY